MKINNLFTKLTTTFLLLVPLTSTSFLLANCANSNNGGNNYNKYINYIADRTFSLNAYYKLDGDTKTTVMWGTCWILAKADETIDSYHYYCATNLHVSYPAFSLTNAEYIEYKISNYNSESVFSIKSDYYTTVDKDYIKVANGNDYLTYANDDANEKIKKENSIDFNILDVDFTESLKYDSHNLKSKLDNLNQFYEKHGYINQFADVHPKDTVSGYCAGYPAYIEEASSFLGTRFAHKFLSNLSINEKSPHGIDPGFYDVSQNYISNIKYEDVTFPLQGGSSGSMLINSDFQVMGIYWGGFISQDNQYMLPSFSIFHSEKKDFIENYINKAI